MRNFLLAAISLLARPAVADTQAWVQAVAGGGYEARLLTSDTTCPLLKSDKGDAAMAVRAPENCAARRARWNGCTAGAGASAASAASWPIR